MNKEELLNSDFLKQFKNSKEFTGFMEQLYKEVLKKCLKESLISIKAIKSIPLRARIAVIQGIAQPPKLLKQCSGETSIEVPCDRSGSFESVIVPKRSRLYEVPSAASSKEWSVFGEDK